MTLKAFKREYLISELTQLGVTKIDGKSLSSLDTDRLQQKLAIIRAANY